MRSPAGLQENACQPSTQHVVDELLDTAALAGHSVVRTWAFCDGDIPHSMQKEPGVLCEEGCIGLDYVIAAAAKRGLRLILCLTDYWPAYGGLQQYVRWATGATGTVKPDDFYLDARARWYFREYTRAIIGRVNTVNGIPYKDDPTIFAWSIINEPRCEGDKSCTIVKEFIGQMARLIKKLDQNHLVTFDPEGFFGPSTEDLVKYNPYGRLVGGVDFCSDAEVPEIDYTSVHLWMDNWSIEDDPAVRASFIQDWISAHVQVSNGYLEKPVLLTEFGTSDNKLEIYREIFQHVTGTQDSEPLIPGAMFWHLATPDFAGWNLYAICTSEEIRRKLRNLSSPSLSKSLTQAEQGLAGVKIELEMATKTKVEKTDSWAILLMCWQFASILVDNWFPSPWLMDSGLHKPGCFCFCLCRYLAKIRNFFMKGLSKLSWMNKI